MEPDDDLNEVADAILEGRTIDWETVETPGSDPDGRVLRQLRVLEALAAMHRQLPSTPGVDTFGPPGSAFEHDRPRWGHLLLYERVGRGAFGAVFRAWDTRLDREVALKLLDAEPGSRAVDSTVIAEGRLLARVRHPNVVTVYGAERVDGRVGIWTEFVRGRTLAQIVRSDGPLDTRAAAAIGIEICQALGAVHDAGLLHRDIKAENVMREDGGRIVLMDLGASTERLIEDAGLRREVTGTPLYVAPEILEGARATPQSDVYSVGVLLYHLVTGAYPVRAGSLDEVRRAHQQRQRAPLSGGGRELPPAFVKVVERALHADPRQRHATVFALEDALRSVVPEIEGRSPDTTGFATTNARGTWLMAALGAALAVMVGRLALDAGERFQDPREPDTPVAGVTGEQQPAMRQVPAPPMGLFGSGGPSFDGRTYVNVDLNQDLMVFDLARGTASRLTNRGDWDDQAGHAVLSPDGAAIAYAWEGAGRPGELRVIDSRGGAPRTLAAPEDVDVQPIEWSRDGSGVLCLLRDSPSRARLALVGAEGGTPRVITAFEGFVPDRISLSPDGAFVVFDTPAADGSPQRDIAVQSTRGGPASILHAHPAHESNPLWTPDGRSVFFVSDRSSTVDGWILPVTNGVAQGEPTMVARNIGRIEVSGFTAAGALYYWRQTGDMDVFTVPLERGSPSVQPTRVVSRVAGANSGPAWSPDGRQFAYISQRPERPVPPRAVIVVGDEVARTERQIAPVMRRIAPVPLRWSPDGRSLLVRGDRDGRPGAFVLDVASGRLDDAVTIDEAHMTDLGPARWWRDARSIAYLSPRGLVARDLRTGVEQVVFNPTEGARPLRLTSVDLSPDLGVLAFSAVVTGTEPAERVVGVASSGGAPRILARTAWPEQMHLQGWAPAGNELLVTRWNTRVSGPHALWRVSAADGAAEDTAIRIPGFTQANLLQVHPSGTRLAYTANEASWDLWVIEHFLPGAAH